MLSALLQGLLWSLFFYLDGCSLLLQSPKTQTT